MFVTSSVVVSLSPSRLLFSPAPSPSFVSCLDYAFSISMHPSLLFLLFPRAQLPDVRHLHLSLVILRICCLPSSRHTCPLLVAPSPVFQLPRLTCAILHRVVSWTVELNGFFLFFLNVVSLGQWLKGADPWNKCPRNPSSVVVVIVHQAEGKKKNQTIFIPYCSLVYFYVLKWT